jgi:hypothetical protein
MSYQENEEDEQRFENVKIFIEILKQEMLSPESDPFRKLSSNNLLKTGSGHKHRRKHEKV